MPYSADVPFIVPPSLLYFVAFVWGAVWGSFLNVCIYRIPAGISIVRPASRCPICETPLKAWHNIPILSWIFLRGRCAFCGAPIPVRYALVELLTGVLSAALLARAMSGGGGVESVASVVVPFIFQFAFVAALIVITFIDVDHMEIPNAITIPGVLIGFIAAWVIYPETGVTWWHSLLGAVIGGGSLLLVIGGYAWLTGREGMGLGDFKLMAMVGAFLGVQSLPFVLFASSVQGLLYAVILLLVGGGEAHREQLAALDAQEAREAAERGESGALGDDDAEDAVGDEPSGALERIRTMPIPFGPFIALGAIEWLFFGTLFSAWIEGWV